MSKKEGFFESFSKSIAPSIFGSEGGCFFRSVLLLLDLRSGLNESRLFFDVEKDNFY